MLAAHFGRTHNCNSMFVKLKYKIQMFNNKRKQNTNVGSPFWSHTWLPVILSPTPAETAEHCQSTHMGWTNKIQTRSWCFAKCILFEHKAQSREHSTLVPHSDLRLGGSLILMLLKLSWVSSGFVSQPSSHLRPRTACFCVSQSTQPTQFSSISKNSARKDGGLDGDVG